MPMNSSNAIADWTPISYLRQIETDIAGFGYSKDFIEKNGLLERRSPHGSNMITGQINFFESLEVKEDGGEVFYRESDKHYHMHIPDIFETQFGTFLNHNNGEFESWLNKEGFLIEGNFCDLFDCGDYVYAVSNLMHMGLGEFKIVRIDKELDYKILFDNNSINEWVCLEYDGRVINEEGYIIIASGFSMLNNGQEEERYFRNKTLLFQVDGSGGYQVIHEWPFKISSPNSIAALNGYVYFGQNKMVTRVDLKSGERVYLTNKNDAELAALQKM